MKERHKSIVMHQTYTYFSVLLPAWDNHKTAKKHSANYDNLLQQKSRSFHKNKMASEVSTPTQTYKAANFQRAQLSIPESLVTLHLFGCYSVWCTDLEF